MLFRSSKYVLDYLTEKQRSVGLTPAENRVLNETNALGNTNSRGGRYNQAHEMISHGMTTPELMQVLETIPYSKTKSVYSHFVELMRQLLGLAPKHATALSEVMRLTQEIMEESAAPLQAATLKGARLRSEMAPWSERDMPSQFGREQALTTMAKKMRESYDESFSPDDAYDAAYNDATKEEQYILRQLKKDDMLGFDYPHQAIQAIIEEPTAYDLSPQLKTSISRLGNKIEGPREALTSAEINNIQPATPAPTKPTPALEIGRAHV